MPRKKILIEETTIRLNKGTKRRLNQYRKEVGYGSMDQALQRLLRRVY